MRTTGLGENAEDDGPPLLRLGAREWFQRLGHVTGSIGSKDFHRELIDLFGSSIRHESCWIIRFGRASPPEVMFTHNVPERVVATYSDTYAGVDPFSDHWRRHCRAGVLMLSQAARSSEGSEPYSKVFLPNARISDEMGLFLPTIGDSCLGLFLEREQGHFSKTDVQRADQVFPALAGCHNAHISSLFSSMRNIREMELAGFVDRPMLVKDRFGADVYANDAWREAVVSDRDIPRLVSQLSRGSSPQFFLLDSFALKVKRLEKDFLLAPEGWMFVLEPHCSQKQECSGRGQFPDLLKKFTPRERDILSLIMNDLSTGQIAQALEISKGTIKNYKLRIYRKADVASERALIKKFTPVFRQA